MTHTKESRSPGRDGPRKKPPGPTFTARQGQFLAFIHQYRRLHRQGPADSDMMQFFRLTPPSVHGMVVRLEQLGLVTRQRGVARSVRVAVSDEAIPALEEAEGPPW